MSTQSLCSEPAVAAGLLHKRRTSVRGEIFVSAASATSPFPHAGSKEEVGWMQCLLHTLMLRVTSIASIVKCLGLDSLQTLFIRQAIDWR